MKKILFASIISVTMLACGETPGTGSDSPSSPQGPSNQNSGADSSTTAGGNPSGVKDSGQIMIMSSDSSQLKRSSDSARARSGAIKPTE